MINNIPVPVANPFPMNVLPQICHLTIDEINRAYSTLPELSAPIVLATVSAAVQGAFDVDVPGLGRGPTATGTLIDASSGAGKTIVFNRASEPLRIFETERAQQNRAIFSDYQARLDAWQAAVDACKSVMKKRFTDEQPVDDLVAKLKELLANKPKSPRKFQLLYSDATPAAIKQGLSEGGGSIVITTDEGSIFFTGRMVSEWGLLNQTWDGGSIILNRKDEEIVVKNPRVTMLIQVQDGVVERYLERHGDTARDIGALARLLPVKVASNQGWRFRQDVEFEFKHLPEFHRRIRNLLDISIDADGEPVREKKLLRFSPLARELFFELHNEIEKAQQPGAWLSNAKDYAAKVTRNMARIAAQLHLIEYGPTSDEISYDTLARASAVSNFFTHEFLRMFTTPPGIPKPVQDADILYQWMCQFAQKNGTRFVVRADVQKYGPYALRKLDVCDAAIEVLMRQGRISGWLLGKTNIYDLNPTWGQDPIAAEYAINQSRSRRKK